MSANWEPAVAGACHLRWQVGKKCSDSHELFRVQNDDECSASVASRYFLTVSAAQWLITGALLRRGPAIISGTVSDVGRLPRRDSTCMLPQRFGDASPSAERWSMCTELPSLSLPRFVCTTTGKEVSDSVSTFASSTLACVTFMELSGACCVLLRLVSSSAITRHRCSFSSKCLSINNPSDDDANRCHSMNSGRTMNEIKPAKKHKSTASRPFSTSDKRTCLVTTWPNFRTLSPKVHSLKWYRVWQKI